MFYILVFTPIRFHPGHVWKNYITWPVEGYGEIFPLSTFFSSSLDFIRMYIYSDEKGGGCTMSCPAWCAGQSLWAHWDFMRVNRKVKAQNSGIKSINSNYFFTKEKEKKLFFKVGFSVLVSTFLDIYEVREKETKWEENFTLDLMYQHCVDSICYFFFSPLSLVVIYPFASFLLYNAIYRWETQQHKDPTVNRRLGSGSTRHFPGVEIFGAAPPLHSAGHKNKWLEIFHLSN